MTVSVEPLRQAYLTHMARGNFREAAGACRMAQRTLLAAIPKHPDEASALRREADYYAETIAALRAAKPGQFPA